MLFLKEQSKKMKSLNFPVFRLQRKYNKKAKETPTQGTV